MSRPDPMIVFADEEACARALFGVIAKAIETAQYHKRDVKEAAVSAAQAYKLGLNAYVSEGQS